MKDHLPEEFPSNGDEVELSASDITQLLSQAEEIGARGDFQEAARMFYDAYCWSKDLGNGELVCRALDRLASSYWELGQIDRAETCLRESYTIAEALNDEEFFGFAQYRLAWVLIENYRKGQEEQIFGLLNSARSTAKQFRNTYLIAECDEKAGFLYGEMGQHQKSAQVLRSAADVLDATGHSVRSLLVRANYAIQLELAGDEHRALQIFNEILEIAAENNVLERVKGVGRRAAKLLSRKGDTASALAVLRSVEPCFENYPNRFEYGLMLSMRARVLVDGGETTQAIEACRAAFEIERECSGRHKLELRAELFETLGICRKLMGELDQADGNFAQAVLAHLAVDDWDEAHRVAQHIRDDIDPDLPTNSEPFIVGTYL